MSWVVRVKWMDECVSGVCECERKRKEKERGNGEEMEKMEVL